MIFSINHIINVKVSIILFIVFIFIGYCDKYFNYYEPHMNGHSSFTMKPVVQQYRRFVEQNQDLGSSFAVYINSTSQLDLLSGYEDLEFKQSWNKNTITQLFSLSNIIGVLSIAHLVDKGQMSYSDKLSQHVSNCHPSIANKTISEIMMHKAGIPYLKTPTSVTSYRDDSDVLLKMLLSQGSLLSGDRPVFHKHTQGLLVDALIREVDPTHRSLPHYFIEEIAHKLKIDIFVGLPRTQLYRTARVYRPTLRHYIYALGRLDVSWISGHVLQQSETAQKVDSSFSDLKDTIHRDADILEISLPSWNVFSNADSLAMMVNGMLFGSLDRKPVLKPSTVAEMCADGQEHYDEVIGTYVSFTRGGLMSFDGPKKSVLCGWRDSTGQFLMADLKRNLTIGYVTNHLRALSLDKDYIVTYIVNSLYDMF